MEITRALHPVNNNVQAPAGRQADAKRAPLPFARGTPAAEVGKDGSFMTRVGDVYRGCEKLGLEPGQQVSIMVGDQPMVLRRTQSADAYVLQTPDEAVNAPFNGLHVSNQSIAKIDMKTVTPGQPNFLADMRRIQALSNALSVQPSDWHGFHASK